ncbi:Ribonuclease III [Bertholletia excelsa]
MASSSWMRSLLSPARSWFAAEPLKALSRCLRDYGWTFGGLLNTRDIELATSSSAKEISLSQEELNLKTEPLPLQEVEGIIGYNFYNRDLLEEAFTHASYRKKCLSYERLEYVGDSVLNLLVTKEQFSLYQNLSPGLLSPLRAANVDTEKLARVAVNHKLHMYLRHEEPMFNKQIQGFIRVLPQYPLHSNGLLDAPKVLADIVESTIGAVFIDSNSSIDTTWKVAKVLLQPIITPEMLQTHPVRKLYETCQKNGLRVRFVDLWSKQGIYKVFIDNRLRGRGNCRARKDIALNRAANDAYNEIVKNLGVKHE